MICGHWQSYRHGAHLLQPSMKGCSTAISEAWAASSTSTFSKAFSSRLKMRRPVLDSVVNTISASCTKDSSRFSCTCNSKDCNQAAMQALSTSITWPSTLQMAIDAKLQDSVVSSMSASCSKCSSRYPGPAEARAAT